MSAPGSSFLFARVSMRALVCFAALSLCFDAGAAEPASNAATPGIARWAIVSSKAVKEMGLADLVFIEAAKISEIELVERDRADAIQDEAVLVLANETDVVEQRLELGRKLTADALVLLTMAEPEKQNQAGVAVGKCLKIVIADCRYGARMARRIILANSPPDKLAQDVASCIAETQKKYAGGIKQIVGVAPFVSRNIEHDFDHLQRGVAYLLESALSALPGVAVLETEEAAEIATENVAAGDTARRRFMPVFVSGVFRVDRRQVSNETVAVVAHLKQGLSKDEVVATNVPLASVAPWVKDTLASRLMVTLGAADTRPLSAAEQVGLLVREADAFSWLGQWREAAGLRDAALLLEPGNTEQAVKLVAECAEAREAVLAQTTLEKLVRTKAIGFRSAVGLCTLMFHGEALDGAYLLRIGKSIALLPEESDQADANRQYSFMRYLPTDEAWANLIDEVAAEPWKSFTPLKEEYLEVTFRLLTEILPKDCPWPWNTERCLESTWEFLRDCADRGKAEPENPYQEQRCFPDVETSKGLVTRGFIASNEVSEADWLVFLGKLKAADSETVRLLGRAGLVFSAETERTQSWADLNVPPASRKEVEQEVSAIMREARKLQDQWNNADPKRSKGAPCVPLEFFLQRLHSSEEFASSREEEQRAAQKPLMVLTQNVLHASAAIPATAPSEKTVPGVRSVVDRIRLEPINLSVKTLDGRTVPFEAAYFAPGSAHIFSAYAEWIVPCSTNLEIWRFPTAVCVLRNDGILQELATFPQFVGRSVDVACDGRFVWIAYPDAVHALTLDRRTELVVSRAEGLPPATTMKIHCLKAGKALVAGSCEGRAWLATVDISGKAPTVSVFHEATHAWPANDESAEYDFDPSARFTPAWIRNFDPAPRSETRLVLVGRTLQDRGTPTTALVVDTVSSNVSVLGYHIRLWNGPVMNGPVTCHGEIFAQGMGGMSLVHYGKTEDALENGNSSMEYCDLLRLAGVSSYSGTPGMVAHKGWIYLFSPVGSVRMNMDTLQEEVLSIGPLPQRREYVTERFSESGIYGIVRLTPEVGGLDRIIVDNDASPPTARTPALLVDAAVDREVDIRRNNGSTGNRMASAGRPEEAGTANTPATEEDSSANTNNDGVPRFHKIVILSPKPNDAVVTPTFRIVGYVQTPGETPVFDINGEPVLVVPRKPPEQNIFDFDYEARVPDENADVSLCWIISSHEPGSDITRAEKWLNVPVRTAIPQLKIEEPADGAVISNQHAIVKVENLVVVDESQWPSKAQIRINGVSAVKYCNTWQAWVTFPNAGKNEIKAIYKDEFGRIASKTSSVMCRLPPGYNPLEDDDHDGVPNGKDLFPDDSKESSDKDVDGWGDNEDPDDNREWMNARPVSSAPSV